MCKPLIISTSEHQVHQDLGKEELIELTKSKNKLVESVDLPNQTFTTGYYIGLSWLNKSKVLFVNPKLDGVGYSIDYLKMLSLGLTSSHNPSDYDDLYSIDFKQPSIRITSSQDLITPLLIISFIQIVNSITKKGLKQGYRKTTSNLRGRIKGKLLVTQSTKNFLYRRDPLLNSCAYEEHGISILENQIIKKALEYSVRYLSVYKLHSKSISAVLGYILPAFHTVDSNIDPRTSLYTKPNPFFPEYVKALELATLLFKRFGYSINKIVSKSDEIDIQPFWINMPKIFELYILHQLRKKHGDNDILYQPTGNYGEPDFLNISSEHKRIIDAKYKKLYQNNSYIIEDIRQLSGYGRDKKILKLLGVGEENIGSTVVNSTIIYPDFDSDHVLTDSGLSTYPIKQFTKFYKVGISLPVIYENQEN